MKNYVTYHLHTELSLLDSCTNYKLYIDKAIELGQSSICFTEHGNIYNWINKKMYCDKNNIKYIHGVEMYLTKSLDDKIRDNFHTILICRNYEGLKELNKLIDISTQEDHFYYKNRITFDEFLNISDNIIRISACLASPLNRLDIDDIYYEKLLNKYDYYEVQPHIYSESQKVYNQKLWDLSLKYNKPLIAGTDTHSLNSYKSECRDILQKSKKIEYSDEDKYDLTYKSYNEVVEMFKQQDILPESIYLEAINNTNIMSDSIVSFELDLSFKYPILYDNEESVFKKLINTKYKYKIKQGIINKDKIYKDNILEELRVIKKVGMIGFMLFMSEMMTWCKDNGIPFGNCRGSVGGSTIAYILDIIDLNPIKWNTVFSRFANESRVEIGDIDVDFSPSQRELVYNYIINRFGTDYTAYILAIGTIVDKGTIDTIGRALDYPLPTVSLIKDEYEKNPEEAKVKYPDLFYYFDGLLNTSISQSMHPAGMIASPISLPDNYGTIWKEGKRILCINMEEVHEVSLVKYDILGLKNIEIIKDTCSMLDIPYPLSHEIDWEDRKVWDDIITSNVGIFQFEGSYAFNLLKNYVPLKINDLSLVNACLRPSGASYRDKLIAREFNNNPSVLIDSLLKNNNGFLVFQEDVIAFLQQICGLSGSEADNVRRAIGRKQKDRIDEALPKILEGYCNKSDKPREESEKEAKEFLDIIESASSYMFGYNHSTGYSMIGYLCGYFRYYHPIEFITAYLNNANNEEDTNNGIELAKLKNIKIKPIEFGQSIDKYTFDKTTNTIYKGIESIKFCNAQIAYELYELRNNKYNTFVELLKDIVEKTSVNSRHLMILTGLGFFRKYGKNKKLLSYINIFSNFNGRKQIKKSELEKLGLTEVLIKKYSNKETEALYKEIDIIGLITELTNNIEDASLSVKEQVKFEKDYLEYVVYTNPEVNEKFYIVIEYTTYNDKRKPYVTLKHIQTGDEIKTKIKDPQVFIENPFKLYDVLKVNEWKQQYKTKNIGGKWQKTSELEDILYSYEVY